MKRFAISFFLSLISAIIISCNAGELTCKVQSQSDFDRLQGIIIASLKDPYCTGLKINLKKGVYYFREKHLQLVDVNRPDFTLKIIGKGAVLTAAGTDFLLSGGTVRYPGKYETRYGYVLDRTDYQDVQSFVCQADSPVESVGDRLFRFKADEVDMGESACKDMYLILSRWYQGALCKVCKIQDGYVYFSSENKLSDLNGDYEYSYKKKFPKYLMYNHPGKSPMCVDGNMLRASASSVHQCEVSNFLLVSRCRLRSFLMKGVIFTGNALGNALILYVDTDIRPFEIASCRFNGIHDRVVNCLGGSGLYFHDNLVSHSYRDDINSDPYSNGTRVICNRFTDNGYLWTNRFDVVVQGEDFEVRGNTFQDFSYGGVGAGIHYLNSAGIRTSGIIEKNEFFQSESFRRPPSRTLMDSGAIYLWTMNKDVTIRNNYIHDIDGGGDNRGIFGDDGAVNVKVYDNVVLGIENSFCIDFRKVLPVEKKAGSQISRVNVGNEMSGNTVDGSVRFIGREDGSADDVVCGENRVITDMKTSIKIIKQWKRAQKK